MKTAYIGGILLDGTKDMVPQKGKTVIVENGRIKEILSAEIFLDSLGHKANTADVDAALDRVNREL